MPGMRYIELPDPVQLKNHLTGEVFSEEKPIAFVDLLHRLLSNPKWAENYTAIKSADAIISAYTAARDGVMVLADDDWVRLKDAVETPRIVAQGPGGQVVMPGLGFHPIATRQLLPLLRSIVEAKDKPLTLRVVEG